MADNGALYLEVTDWRDANHWRWQLKDAAGKFLTDHEVALDPNQPQHAAFLDLEGYLGTCAAPDKWPEDEVRLMAEVGVWIGEQVLGPIGPRILDYGTPITVRVVVPTEALLLHYRPLELAYVRGKPLALHDVSLVFELKGEKPPMRAQPTGPVLRMLAVFSLPTDASALALRRERYALQQLMRRIAQTYNLALDLRVIQYGVTRDALGNVLEEGDGWDLIHFSGHGLPGELALEKPDGRSDLISANELLELLRPARGKLKLVTLSACLSAAATVEETLRLLGIKTTSPPRPSPDLSTGEGPGVRAAALARALVQDLDCAVMAMRYPVGDDFAISLGAELYERLLGKKQPLPRALQLSLPRALQRGPSPGVPPLSVATPALFGQRATGLKLEAPPGMPERPVEARIGLAYFPNEPERFVGRIGPMTRASQALAPQSGKAGALFDGMAGAGKTACALELAYRYRDEPRFQHFVWYKAPEAGRDIESALLNLAQAMETQIPGFTMVHLVDRADEFKNWLPRLTEMLEGQSILFVLDNLESLLTSTGAWRDERWSWLVEALLAHRGLSRTVLTSRTRPASVDERKVQVEAIHALSLAEAVLLARELPNLGRLLRGEKVGLARGRELVARTLKQVQGHPKLIELADGQAANPDALARQLDEIATLWAAGESSLQAFFERGESPLDAQAFLTALSGWTTSLSAALPPGSRTLFHLLCTLEEGDRQSGIVQAVWPILWQRLNLPGQPPDLATTLPPLSAAGLVEVETVPAEGDAEPANQRFRLHPGVADAGRGEAGEALQAAVDTALAAFWIAAFQHGVKEELRGAGASIAQAGRSAAPYLLRQRSWAEASTVLEQVIYRDPSPGTTEAVLPWLRRIAGETKGSDRELSDAGVLAHALLQARRWPEAEAMMRDIIRQAAERGAFRTASATSTDLINILHTSGRAEDALPLAEEMKDYTRRAGLGPWTQLLDEGQRLQLLTALGRYEEVLSTVQELRRAMQVLPEKSEQEEATEPWNVREVILDTGSEAAVRLEHWQQALDLNAAIIASKETRGASPLEVAHTRFNDYGPLLRLRRYDEARPLLHACRAAFEAERDVVALAAALSALADLEDKLGHRTQAIAFEETALRYRYVAGGPRDCAISHINLSNYLLRADQERKVYLAHSLAAGVVSLQSGSGHLTTVLSNLAIYFAQFAPEPPPVPASFDELCTIVEQVEGVRFRELFERLPRRVASGDEALQAVVALAMEQAKRMAEEEKEEGEKG